MVLAEGRAVPRAPSSARGEVLRRLLQTRGCEPGGERSDIYAPTAHYSATPACQA